MLYGSLCEKVFKQGVGMAVCNKGGDDGIKNIDFSRLPFVLHYLSVPAMA